MVSSLEKAGMKIDYFDCECADAGHIVRFTYDDGTTSSDKKQYEPFFCIEHQLAHDYHFWQRLKVAWNYLWGRSNNWSCTMLNVDNAEQMKKVIERYQQKHKEWKLKEHDVCTHCEGQGGVSSCNKCGLCAFCKRVDGHDKDCPTVTGDIFHSCM